MKILGALFAGGQSRRFGADKALAPVHGQPLIAHALAALQRHAPESVICGRPWPGVPCLPDLHPGLGPLAALEAALTHAAAHGYSHVLTSACDIPELPQYVVRRLSPAPAIAMGQPLLGLWPADLAPALSQQLAAGMRRMQDWVAASTARPVDLGAIANINTPADLAAFTA
jgi:molybdopterin-guanine dinucleotide biosynthesis protein A